MFRRGLVILGFLLSPLFPAAAQEPANTIRIGVEYAFPGLGKTFAELGVPAVKLYPGLFAWGKMQKNKDAPIDFTILDRLVKDYHDAGFEDIYISLSTINSWANKGFKNYTPKKEYWPHFEAWIKALVERYDKDGKNPMPGLKRSVRYWEISEEFSSYTPEPTADYLEMLERASRTARAVSPKVKILHAAFLTTTIFKDHPGPAQYEAAFAAGPKRFMVKKLADIRAVLDRHDLFDAVNFHALGDPCETEDIVAWLRYEMARRKFNKPIIISDTTPNFLIGWGPATKPAGKPEQLGIITSPATEKDRPRLAAYFQKLVDKDKATLDWNHAFVADDMVKRVIIAAEQKVALINTAFMEDLVLLQLKVLQAGAGTSAWAGFVESKINIFNEQRTIVARRAPFYAIQQFQRHLKDYDSLHRLKKPNKNIRLYHWQQDKKFLWLAWLDSGKLLLPEDAIPKTTLTLKTGPGTFVVEPMIARPGQTRPDQETIQARDGQVEIPLTPRPVYVFPKK